MRRAPTDAKRALAGSAGNAAKGGMTMTPHLSRRTLLKNAAGSAVLAGIGMPAIVHAQADTIRIGHLTPLTGFLGPLGEYAVMGVKLAADEINKKGGGMRRKIGLARNSSGNPQAPPSTTAGVTN